MSEHENQWTKALAENGSFDPEKANRANEAAVAQYVRGWKKIERLLWIYLTGCVAVAAFCAQSFLFAASNKAMIAFGIVFLVAIETTILMKLWYWIVNTKLTLQKEIRQTQLPGAAADSAAYAPSWMAEMPFGRPGLPRWERIAWFVGLILAAIASSGYASYRSIATAYRSTPMHRETIKLMPDGASSSTRMELFGAWKSNTQSFDWRTEFDFKGTIRWLDDRGEELPFEVSTDGGQRHYTVHLIEPLAMGERLRYTNIRELPAAATKNGDLWTYRGGFMSAQGALFLITVELPRGAKIVSVDPQPDEQSTHNNTPRLVFRGTRGCNERFAYQIRYRLAGEGKAQTSSP